MNKSLLGLGRLGGLGLGALALLLASACTNLNSDGGLNDNGHGPGDQPGGVQLQQGDIAVSPNGSYVVFRKNDKLAVGWAKSGAVYELPVDNPGRLSFSKQRDVVYVASKLKDETAIVAVDINEKSVLWSAPLPEGNHQLIAASEDDSRVVAAIGRHVFVLDAADGKPVGFHSLDQEIVDLDLVTGQQARALVMTDHTFNNQQMPTAALVVIDLKDANKRIVDVPNCADKVTLSADGSKALMAPTSCQADPISVIDLTPGKESFLKNLPGFGPVAVSPDDNVAIGFFDTQSQDTGIFDDPSQIPSGAEARFHLMVLDTDALTYKFHAFGDTVPRYSLTPDGNVLLVDNALASGGRLFDIDAGVFKTIDGPVIKFNEFSVNSDSSHVYLLNRMSEDSQALSLLDLDLHNASAALIATDFHPLNINIAPDDTTLFLRVNTESICVFSLATHKCEQNITVGASQL